MVVPLHPGAGVLLIGPAQCVKVDARLDHNRLVEGKPAGDFAVKALKHLFRIANEQLDDVLRRPAAVGLQQHARQFVVFQADHRLNALTVHFIEQRVVIGGVLFIYGGVFIVGQKARPVDRGAIVRQSRLLHQRHVFAKAIDKVGCHRRAVAVVPDVTIVLVPEIDPRILPRLFAAPALGLPGRCRRAQHKIWRYGYLFYAHPALMRYRWLVAVRPDLRGVRQFSQTADR